MLYHKQLHVVTPGSPLRGSCFQTAIACVLDLPIDLVPNFWTLYWDRNEEDNICKILQSKEGDTFGKELSISLNLWDIVLKNWLMAKGLEQNYIDPNILDVWLKNNPDVPYLVSGKSSRGVGHVVIYQNGKMIHDPHPSNEGLTEINEDELPYSVLEPVENSKINWDFN